VQKTNIEIAFDLMSQQLHVVITMSKKIMNNWVELVNGHVYGKKNEKGEYLYLWALSFFHHVILHKRSKCDLGKNKACGCL